MPFYGEAVSLSCYQLVDGLSEALPAHSGGRSCAWEELVDLDYTSGRRRADRESDAVVRLDMSVVAANTTQLLPTNAPHNVDQTHNVVASTLTSSYVCMHARVELSQPSPRHSRSRAHSIII